MKFFPFVKRNVNLCLSGGGALGFAHIGAIKALEENGIFPNQISGSSMGAIIGTFYASGISPDEMLSVIKEEKLYKVNKLLTFHPDFWNRGLSDQTILRKLIKKLIPHNSFEGLEKKLFVCVTNMNTARYEIISEGDELDKWIAASASMPGIFEPLKSGDTTYLDGGILNNMPAQCFEYEFKTTIGVDVIPYTKLTFSNEIKTHNVAMASIRVMQYFNSREGKDICNYLIEPLVLNKYHEFSYDDYEDIFKIGYETGMTYIEQHKDILKLADRQK